MHKLTYRGQDVYCVICGRQWSLDEVAPEQCATPAATLPAAPAGGVAINHRLIAFLVGPQGEGHPAVLVYALSPGGARCVLSTITGIHVDDLVAARAESMDRFCRVRHPCPSFNPLDLRRAEKLCADTLVDVFNTQQVVNPFHYKSKDKSWKTI